jgi:uncharacterized protein (TIGR00161 family)
MSEPRSLVEIRDFGIKLKEPTVIVGVPDVGLVGTITCSYLMEQLKLPEVGYIDSEFMPQVMIVRNSKPSNPVHIFAKEDIAVVLSEVPLPPRLSYEITKELAVWSKSQHANTVIGVSGMPSREREESQAEQKPMVVGIPGDDKAAKLLKPLEIRPFQNGAVYGAYASMLKHCMNAGQPSILLLAESLLTFPDPAAAAAVVEVLQRKLSIKIDIKPLLQESEEIRLKSRELIQQTHQMAQQAPPSLEGIYR